MTQMGINYLTYLETSRSNLTREGETYRHNVSLEELGKGELEVKRGSLDESIRSNIAREKENLRSNLAREIETHRSNVAHESISLSSLAEQARSNVAREAETHRSNVTRETETQRLNSMQAMGHPLAQAYVYKSDKNVQDQFSKGQYLSGIANELLRSVMPSVKYTIK